MTGTWIRYNDGDDNKRLALELDIAMNGVDGAAKSPALIDVLAQAVDYFKNAKTYHILPIDDIKEHEESAYCDCYPRIEPHGLNNVVIHNSFDGREALEQPIARINIGDKGKVTFEEQPAQEPVAFIDVNWLINYTEHGVNSCYEPTVNPNGKLNIGTKLYTHPAPSCSCKDKNER